MSQFKLKFSKSRGLYGREGEVLTSLLADCLGYDLIEKPSGLFGVDHAIEVDGGLIPIETARSGYWIDEHEVHWYGKFKPSGINLEHRKKENDMLDITNHLYVYWNQAGSQCIVVNLYKAFRAGMIYPWYKINRLSKGKEELFWRINPLAYNYGRKKEDSKWFDTDAIKDALNNNLTPIRQDVSRE